MSVYNKRFFISNQVGLKVEQLAKQPPTLKIYNVVNFTWIKLYKLNVSTTVSGTTYLCTIALRADTGNKIKINFTYSLVAFMPGLSKFLV